MRKAILLGVIMLLSGGMQASDSLQTNRDGEQSHKLWASIYASYYTGLGGEVVPQSAFGMPTALLGYKATLSGKLTATLIYDVARTTNAIRVVDEQGRELDVSYKEGSRYTAFLKMAEIKYSPLPFLDLRVGQLLNTQYLTVQDKFWGYRYVYFTYQEVHRYGNPADFGVQVDLKWGDKLLNQTSVTNGEGPFRHQDESGKFLFSNNIQWYPFSGAIVKLYVDYAPTSDTVSNAKDRYAISAFAGWRSERYRFALEYNRVANYAFRSNSNYWGWSTFFSYTVLPRVDMFARYDYINRSAILNVSKGHLLIFGIQYRPVDKLYCSVNVRSLNPDAKRYLYLNFGLKF